MTTPRSIVKFASALAQGLAWGVAAAAVIGAAAGAATASPASAAQILSSALEVMVWTALVASLLAIAPIGPIAGVLGWLIYRGGARSPTAFAAAGAIATGVTPTLVFRVLEASERYPVGSNLAILSFDGEKLLTVAFALIGAFAGFMAGRAIRASEVRS